MREKITHSVSDSATRVAGTLGPRAMGVPSPLTVYEIGWEGEVGWLVVLESLEDGSVDLFTDVGRPVALDVGLLDVCLGDGDVRVDALEGVEAAVSEGVVQHETLALQAGRGYADDVKDGDVLRVGTGDTVGSACVQSMGEFATRVVGR